MGSVALAMASDSEIMAPPPALSPARHARPDPDLLENRFSQKVVELRCMKPVEIWKEIASFDRSLG